MLSKDQIIIKLVYKFDWLGFQPIQSWLNHRNKFKHNRWAELCSFDGMFKAYENDDNDIYQP